LLQTSFSSEASHYCELGQGGCGTQEMAIHNGEAYSTSQQVSFVLFLSWSLCIL